MSEPARIDWWPRFIGLLRLTGRRLPAAERAGVRESTVRDRIKRHDDFAAEYHDTMADYHRGEADRLREKVRALERIVSGDVA